MLALYLTRLNPVLMAVMGKGNSDCHLPAKIMHQHLNWLYLHCLESIEGKIKWLSQICTYQYMQIGPGLAEAEVISLCSRGVIQVVIQSSALASP